MIDTLYHVIEKPVESQLLALAGTDWDEFINKTVSKLDSCDVKKAGLCIMDASLLDHIHEFRKLAAAFNTGRFWGVMMPSLTAPLLQLRSIADAGYKGVVFHSYLQRIAPDDYPTVIDFALAAVELGMVPGFCTAYGSRNMYNYDPLALVAAFANQCSAPTVLYHMGGAKILEAFLLCDAWPQLILETSFSLPYWIGSSIEADMAFAIRRLGAERVMFGSDHPFMPLDTAIASHLSFFERHHISKADQEMIMGETAGRVFRL